MDMSKLKKCWITETNSKSKLETRLSISQHLNQSKISSGKGENNSSLGRSLIFPIWAVVQLIGGKGEWIIKERSQLLKKELNGNGEEHIWT